MMGGAICLASWTVIQNGWHHIQSPGGTDKAIRTLEMAVLERFPDGVIPPLLGLTTRSDGSSQYTSHRFVST